MCVCLCVGWSGVYVGGDGGYEMPTLPSISQTDSVALHAQGVWEGAAGVHPCTCCGAGWTNCGSNWRCSPRWQGQIRGCVPTEIVRGEQPPG